MSQPTRTTSLPTRPTPDPRRAQLMGALALAEHLVSLGEPVPDAMRIDPDNGKAVVHIYLHHNAAAVRNYQDRFGGTIRSNLHMVPGYAPKWHTELTGVAFDGQFRVWTLVPLAEQEFAALFVAEHGDPADWSADRHAAYEAAIAALRSEASR